MQPDISRTALLYGRGDTMEFSGQLTEDDGVTLIPISGMTFFAEVETEAGALVTTLTAAVEDLALSKVRFTASAPAVAALKLGEIYRLRVGFVALGGVRMTFGVLPIKVI